MQNVEKTYEVASIRLPFGVMEDLLHLLKIDEIDALTEEAMLRLALDLVTNGIDTIKNLLKTMFVGLTDEELRYTDTFELAGLLMDIVKYAATLMGFISKGKN